MSTVDDLSKLADPEDYYHPQREKESLLSKYRIPIQHFEYEYVEKCTDGKELEQILQILRSGEEGYYPDLVRVAQERLTTIKPKSKLLRTLVPVLDRKDLSKDELNDISQDLESFVSDITKYNKELESRKSNRVNCEADVRTFKEMKTTASKASEKRISSTDYKAWDKYDPDTEILKMDLEEENEKKSVLEEEKPKKPTAKKSVTFNKFSTEAEAAFESNREREKGNEFFKAGDYEEALQCYNNSIASKSCVNNLNNRAATYLKLKKYALALEDCEKVLSIERGNLKALLRKAEALEGLKRYEEALDCASVVIQTDPNNSVAQELAERVRKHCGGNLRNTRMKIVEIQ